MITYISPCGSVRVNADGGARMLEALGYKTTEEIARAARKAANVEGIKAWRAKNICLACNRKLVLCVCAPAEGVKV